MMIKNKLAFIGTCLSSMAYASDYYSPELLQIYSNGVAHATNADVSVFEENSFLPGNYRTEIYLNQKHLDTKDLEFVVTSGDKGEALVTPCLTAQDLHFLGINGEKADVKMMAEQGCVDINEQPYLSYQFRFDEKKLLLSVPQAYIDQSRYAAQQEKNWDNGIEAVFANYSFSGGETQTDDERTRNYYANIRSGINIGPWRYRNYSTWRQDDNDGHQWTSISQTLSRNVNTLKSELILGQMYSSSMVFDTVKLKGLQLQSDTRMLPNFMQVYAPSVSGIANTEARITITQNNNVIYRNTVPAGPFNITDYYPMGNGGNLYVSVIEADGAEKNFIVPFSSIANLERANHFRYSLSTGKYDSDQAGDGQYFSQAEAFYGLTDYLTAYGGMQWSSGYQSYAIGTGLNLGDVGALNVDMIHAKAQIHEDHLKQDVRGRSFRFNYAKNIVATNTNLTVVGYRHFDQNYLSFNDAMALKEGNGFGVGRLEQLQNEYNVSISQLLPQNYGSMNASAVYYKYADKDNKSSYNIGYYNSYHKINYSVYYTSFRHKNTSENGGQKRYSLNLNISIPLSVGAKPVWSNYSLARNNEHQTNQSFNVNGVFGEHNQGSWGVSQGYGNHDMGYRGGVHGSYRSPYADMSTSYAYAKDNQSINYNVQGSVLATQHGLVIGPPLQETNALIVVDKAMGIRVQNSQSTRTNGQGLAVYSGLSAYRENSIALDMATLPENIDIDSNIKNNMIPTKGAIILTKFNANKGFKLLIKVKTNDDTMIPLGAMATMANGQNFMVASFNQLYAIATTEQGEVSLKWLTNGQTQECHLSYDLMGIQPVNGLYLFEAQCQ